MIVRSMAITYKQFGFNLQGLKLFPLDVAAHGGSGLKHFIEREHSHAGRNYVQCCGCDYTSRQSINTITMLTNCHLPNSPIIIFLEIGEVLLQLEGGNIE